MAPKNLPPRELVRQLLRYCRDTGTWTHLEHPRAMFGSDAHCRAWNTRWAGKPAGSLHANGFIQINVRGSYYKAHRLAWLYVYGEPVPDLIDHADQNRSNNCIDNLRAATASQNQQNKKRSKRSTTKVKGVSLYKSRGNYEAYITINGKRTRIGYFNTLEEAKAARQAAATKLHKEFVRHE